MRGIVNRPRLAGLGLSSILINFEASSGTHSGIFKLAYEISLANSKNDDY